MSWALVVETDGSSFGSDVDGAVSGLGKDDVARNETDDQVKVAVAAAKSIVSSKAVGDDTRKYRITISGHANPKNAAAEGGSPDSVTVTVAQIDSTAAGNVEGLSGPRLDPSVPVDGADRPLVGAVSAVPVAAFAGSGATVVVDSLGNPVADPEAAVARAREDAPSQEEVLAANQRASGQATGLEDHELSATWSGARVAGPAAPGEDSPREVVGPESLPQRAGASDQPESTFPAGSGPGGSDAPRVK